MTTGCREYHSGSSDAPKFKDFILPLIFYKRLSDVFDDEFAKQIEEFGGEEVAREIVEEDHEDALKSGRNPIVRFYIPQEYHWKALRNHPADGHLGEFVTEAMRKVASLNPLLQGVLDVKDFNESQSGQRTLDEERLEALIEVLSRHRLGLQDTEPDILDVRMSICCGSSPKDRGRARVSSTRRKRSGG